MEKILQLAIQPQFWLTFFILFIGMLVTSTLMDVLALRFLTVTRVRRKFTIFDLEFTATPGELAQVIQGIDKLDAKESPRVRNALYLHLLTDFVFMLCVYPGIAMLCVKTASKMQGIGRDLFIILAIAQLVAWLFDIIENLYLLNKLARPEESKPLAHTCYKTIVAAKWMLAIAGAICSVFGLLYFWVTHEFSRPSASVPFILLGIIGVWIFLNARVVRFFSPK